LLASAAGLALVLFSSGMLSARSFASKGRYEIDATVNLPRLERPIWHPQFHKGSLSLALIRARLSPMQPVAALR
jgi:hypothetical protein